MHKRVAKFEKVSFEQFKNDYISAYQSNDPSSMMESPINEGYLKYMYDNIKLPKRATSGSAGYDFYMPTTMKLTGSKSILIPTGIRCNIEPEYVLSVYPRSGLGFKYRVALDNTVGIIDSDYYHSDNEGHIMIKIHKSSILEVTIEEGKAFSQGIFTEYAITHDDDVTEIRNGGFGSTGTN